MKYFLKILFTEISLWENISETRNQWIYNFIYLKGEKKNVLKVTQVSANLWEEWNIYFLKYFIYLWEKERKAEGEAGSMQGAQHRTRSLISRITSWDGGGAKPLSHRGCLWKGSRKTILPQDSHGCNALVSMFPLSLFFLFSHVNSITLWFSFCLWFFSMT